MRNYLFSVSFYLFLLMCGTLLCGQLCVSGEAPKAAENTITLFELTTAKFKDNGGADGKSYESFTSPSLSFVGNVLVVFAQAKDSDGKCDIVEGYFEIEGDGSLDDKDTDINKPKWKKRVTENDDDNKCAENPTTVADKDNMYIFFKNPAKTGGTTEYRITKSETLSNINDNKGIKWGSSKNLMDSQNVSPEKLKDITSVASGGSGIVVNETFVVPVWYTKSTENFVSIITKKTTPADNAEWDLVSNETPVEGIYLAVAEWKEKLIMVTTNKKGLHKVHESAGIKKEWKEAVGSLSNMWEHTKETIESEHVGRNGFITVELKVNSCEKVMLFTKPVKKDGKYDLHLLMSDYQRVYDVGAIDAGSEKNPSSTLLYTEDKLFVAYDKWENGNSTIYAAYLKTQLSDVKKVLGAWTNQNTFLSESCYGADLALTKDKCTDNNRISTQDLVGFLSGNYDDDKKWVDEFLCVNATVTIDGTKVSKVDKGLSFNGTGAGAKWPVNGQGQSQRYYFSNLGFTLVATVKIDNDAGKNSVLGIGFEESSDGKKSIGLWCDEGKWSVSDGKKPAGETVTEKPCVKEVTYQVALILDKNNKFNVYIGKGKEGILPNGPINVHQPLSITHFYFGANAEQNTPFTTNESHVTITNVFLYNRPFEQGEIKKLKEYVKPVEDIKTPDDNKNTTPQSSEQTPTLSLGSDEKNEEGLSPTREGGVGGGVRVFSLLLAVLCAALPLLCVSAPLLHV